MKCKEIVKKLDNANSLFAGVPQYNDVECGTEMVKKGEVVVDVDVKIVKEGDKNFLDITRLYKPIYLTRHYKPIYQCPSCKNIEIN